MSKNNLEILRHSGAHILAAAVRELWPQAKFAIGPAIDNGYYYDFDFGQEKINEEDLVKIEKKMKHIIKQNLQFERSELSIREALKREKKVREEFKAEMIADLEKEGEKIVSYYKLGSFEDLCRGPHVESTGKIKADSFKVDKLAGAYWRGDEKNKMLTRIYALAFASKKELDEYLKIREEAIKRDHRKLGKELDLFIIPSEEVGPGLVIWLPKGAIIRHEIEQLIRYEQTKRGYQYIYTPHIGKKNLWITSGHWDLYRDKMYAPMKIDDIEYLVKPMNCPMHIEVYKHKPRSYRELPFKVAEVATVYRYEQPGELSGLARVRYITQDDAHIFCKEDQVVSEFIEVVEYIEFLYKLFGFNDLEMWLTLRDPKNKKKYLGDDHIWKMAEDSISKALDKKGYDFIRAEGEAKFYGPSLDVMVKDSLGRKWQCATVQVDFMLPKKFNLTYIDKDGKEKNPIMLHRAPLGSIERFVSLLIEHFAGAFPVWLSPVQVKLVAVSEKHADFCQHLAQEFRNENIRVEADVSDETVGNKIRKAVGEKVPYMLVIGDREMGSENLSIRDRGSKQVREIGKREFFLEIEGRIKDKK